MGTASLGSGGRHEPHRCEAGSTQCSWFIAALLVGCNITSLLALSAQRDDSSRAACLSFTSSERHHTDRSGRPCNLRQVAAAVQEANAAALFGATGASGRGSDSEHGAAVTEAAALAAAAESAAVEVATAASARHPWPASLGRLFGSINSDSRLFGDPAAAAQLVGQTTATRSKLFSVIFGTSVHGISELLEANADVRQIGPTDSTAEAFRTCH